MKMLRNLFGSMLLGVFLMNGAVSSVVSVQSIDAQIETAKNALKADRKALKTLEDKYSDIFNAEKKLKADRLANALPAVLTADRKALADARRNHLDVVAAMNQVKADRKKLKDLKAEDVAEDNFSN